MTFKEQIVVRILLMIAKMFTDDPALSKEISELGTHIRVHGSNQ